MNELLLREATDEDIPTLRIVLQAAFEEYWGRLDPPSGAHNDTVEKIRQKLIQSQAVVAEMGQEMVGCVFYQPNDGYMYLSRLAVLPVHRRRGLGKALVDYVEARTRALNLPRVRLGVRVVLKDNLAYYERMGYRVIEYKAHEGYTEPTYMILEKEVTR